MNLKNFEKNIEEKILLRGKSYFENDCIEDIEKTAENEYCAIVLGSDEYNVFVKLDKNDKIIEYSCDCPYDWGNICKHEVAMLYYLRKVISGKGEISTGKIQTIKSDLSNLSKNELIEMIVGLSKRNKIVRQEIYWELGYE